MSKRDYYEVLGLGKSASEDEIKKAYRKAAIKNHPDQGGDEAKFKEVNEANEVLSNSEKRKRYDQFGHAGVGSSAASGGGAGGMGGFGDFFGGAQGVNVDLGDLFGSFFGGGGGQRGGKPRGRDVQTEVKLDFEEAIFGVEKELNMNLEAVCEHCKGTTAEPGHEMIKCDTCKGQGQVNQAIRTPFGNIQQARTCPTCRGKGEEPEKICTNCRGAGTQKQDTKVSIKIPKGIHDGATIRLSEHGEAIANGDRGDLFVVINVKPHKKFTREGSLILSDETISMVDAALGTEIEVETVDGPVTMKIPSGTQPMTDFRLRNHGVPAMKGEARGDHIVRVYVKIPKKLSRKQKKVLEEF